MFTNEMELGRRLPEEIHRKIAYDIYKKSPSLKVLEMSEDEILELNICIFYPECPISKEVISIDFTDGYRFELSLIRCFDQYKNYYHGIGIKAKPNVDDADEDTWLKDYFDKISNVLPRLSQHIPSLEQFNLRSMSNITDIRFLNVEDAKEYIEMLSKSYISKNYCFRDIYSDSIFESNDKKRQQKQTGFDLVMRNNTIKFRRSKDRVIFWSILKYHKIYYFNKKGIKYLGDVLSDSNSYRKIFIQYLNIIYGKADFYTYSKVLKKIDRSGLSKSKRKKLYELVEESNRLGNLQEAVLNLEAKYSYQTVHELLKIMLNDLAVNPVAIPKSFSNDILFNPLKLIDAMETEKNSKKERGNFH